MSDQGNEWKTLSVPDGKGGFITFSQCFKNKVKNNGGTEMTFKERISMNNPDGTTTTFNKVVTRTNDGLEVRNYKCSVLEYYSSTVNGVDSFSCDENKITGNPLGKYIVKKEALML